MRALGEIGALVQKAALGAGIPLGQAEDLARVARHVAGTGGDLQMISDALSEPPAPLDVKWDKDQITVLSGPAAMVAPVIRDAFAMGVTRAVVADAAHAPLVAAFLAQSDVLVDIAGATLTQNGVQTPPTPQGPVDVPDAIWQHWSDLAARTYVPESDASRAAGAGAGLTDND